VSRLIDISPALSARIAVWPGDRPFDAAWTMTIAGGDSCNVGAVSMSVHTGAHVDAPLHVMEGGAPVDALPLEAFVGPCTVVDVGRAEVITEASIASLDASRMTRVLFKTRGRAAGAGFPDCFAHLTPAAASALVRAGARLVGLDTPSADAFTSKEMEAHRILLSAGVAILEGLDLGGVAPGAYELIALPLRLSGLDASPVRAVLRVV
jgi:arylformamidase